MTLPRLQVLLLALGAALGGCSSTPEEKSNAIEQRALQGRIEIENVSNDQERLNLKIQHLETVIMDYVGKLGSARSARDERTMLQLRNHLSNSVESNFAEFRRIAEDPSRVYGREWVVAALGFSGREEVLGQLSSLAFTDEDPAVRSNAIFALGVKASPKTPLEPLMRLVENEEADPNERAGAAWSLLQIQQRQPDPTPTLEFWEGLIRGPIGSTDDMVVKNAIEGLGLSRDARYREAIERHVKHPSPPVRYHVALALGRIVDERSVPVLLSLLDPADPNPNVRLAARKALQSLGGNVDFGENADEWRKHFERG